jgi:hypothetical protein
VDPNKVLSDLLINAQHVLSNEDDYDDVAVELANDILSLDGWIRIGGFLPSDWNAR